MKIGKYKVNLSNTQGRFLLDYFSEYLSMHLPQALAINMEHDTLHRIEVDTVELANLIGILKSEGQYFEDPIKKKACNNLVITLEHYSKQFLLIESC